MQSFWFTPNYVKSWSVSKGVSERFRMEVRIIRDHFLLKKTDELGVEKGTKQITVTSARAGTLKVIMREFKWSSTETRDGHKFPVFNFKVAVFLVKSGRLGQFRDLVGGFETDNTQNNHSIAKGKKIYDDGIKIRFPLSYPFEPPRIKMRGRKYDRAREDAHSHHIFENGELCVMARKGDWDQNRSTVLTALLVAIEWIGWHYREFGY